MHYESFFMLVYTSMYMNDMLHQAKNLKLKLIHVG